MNYKAILEELATNGNLRYIPSDRIGSPMVDFSTNDYLGLAERDDLRQRFMDSDYARDALFTSSASRLLSATQSQYRNLEDTLHALYRRPVLTFNSGYHANTGIIPAITDKDTLIIADKLVHASIIDGMMLSKARWTRFRHNDIGHLRHIIETERPSGENILVIVESVYSMDGDQAPIEELIKLKDEYSSLMFYVDEAHSFGVLGNKGTGLAANSSRPEAWDVIVGTLGKALASMGAFAVTSQTVHDILVNRCRSFIFSTAIPPINAAWSTIMINHMTGMNMERNTLAELGEQLATGLTEITGTIHTPSHIQPVIVGDAKRAVELSSRLERDGLKVLPIRTPTVPPGTERLRISLSAAMTPDDVQRLLTALGRYL